MVHPFPSILDGLVVAGVALIAGGDGPVAVRLGLSMTALQCSIGALNDLHDAESDDGRHPPKPIPAGLVSTRLARGVVIGAAIVGLASAWSVASVVLALALLVLAIGYAYDLLAKGTAWSWLPFALGIPILPVYGWVGAAAGAPSFFLALLPMAILAGTALAMANARVDRERDLATGTDSIAVRLGDERTWAGHVALWLLVALVGLAWLMVAEAPLAGVAAVAAAGAVVLATAIVSRHTTPARLERVWEVEAVAVAVALVAWLAAVLA